MARLPSRRWAAVRQQALDRDNWRCQSCGAYGNEAHHITPIHAGGDPWSLENLMTLCRGCHIDHHIKRRMPDDWAKLVRDTMSAPTQRKERK